MSGLRFNKVATPATPASGKGQLYMDTADKALRFVDDTGAVVQVSPVEIPTVLTADATVTTIYTYTLPAGTTTKLELHVFARRTGGAAGTAEDGAAYVVYGAYKNVAGTATLIGAVNQVFVAESQAGWDATLTVSGGNVLVRVTGAVNNNISWGGRLIIEGIAS